MKRKMFLASLLCALIGTANAQSVSTATYGNASDSKTRTLAVSLNHSTGPDDPEFVAFALQLDLPEGTTVTGVKAMAPLKNGGTINLSDKEGTANVSTDFQVPFQQNGTKCNIVGYNLGNVAIGGESGDVLLAVTLNVPDEAKFNETQITTSSSFVDSEAEESALAPFTPEKGTVERLMGDVVRDNAIDSKDIQAVTLMYGGQKNASFDAFAADINGDGVYDSKDIQAVTNAYGK